MNDFPTAFPLLERGGNGLELTETGMDLRDYFAAQVLPAVYIKHMDNFEYEHHGSCNDIIADEAYRLAYAMMKRRLEPCPALSESRESSNE